MLMGQLVNRWSLGYDIRLLGAVLFGCALKVLHGCMSVTLQLFFTLLEREKWLLGHPS